MDFAGLLVLREFDNYSGRMYLRWATLRSAMLSLKVDPAQARWLQRTSCSGWWCFFSAMATMDLTLMAVSEANTANPSELVKLKQFMKVHMYYTIFILICLSYLLTFGMARVCARC